MKNIKRLLTGIGMTAVGLCLVAGMNHMSVKADSKETIAKGVYIGSVDVGGMTKQEAHDAVDAYMDSLMATNFLLKSEVGQMNITAQEMKLTADVDAVVEEAYGIARYGDLISRYKETKDLEKEPKVVDLSLSLDKQATANKIYDHRDELNVAAVDNSFRIENGNFVFIPGKTGNEVNIVDSVYTIRDFINNDWEPAKTEIALVIDEVQPRGSEEELSKLTDVLGTFSTNFGSSAAGRAQNVRNACSKINGTILYPGEEFSTYEKISPFTQENGYGIAGAYENGQVVESIGGGVCQVATTLYNAVIRAELDITMRYNHSMLVNYVPPSDDAAIAGTYKDFRFKNNMDTPVYIEGTSDGGILSFKVYGVENRPTNRVVTFESETVERKEPEVQFTISSDHDLGYIGTTQSAHQGLVARLWKIVTVDGVEQSREIFNKSTYNASPKLVTVGIRGASEEQAAAIRTAAASKDEAAVRAAVAAAKAEAEKPEEEETENEEENPDTTEPDTTKPENEKPGTSKPDTTKPENEKPDASKPDTSEPGESEPDNSKPDTKPQPEPSDKEEDEGLNSDELVTDEEE